MNILITGATKGIGRAIAELALVSGLNVFATGRTENLLKNFNNYCTCDLATVDGMEKLGQYIKANNIDILINNAGEYFYSDIEKISYEKKDRFQKRKTFDRNETQIIHSKKSSKKKKEIPSSFFMMKNNKNK